MNDSSGATARRLNIDVLRQGLVFTALAISLWSTTVFLMAARPHTGSLDFFYYICFARDMLNYPSEVPTLCYVYFPGVYTFWKCLLLTTDGSLPSLQAGYLWLLTVNAALVGVVIARATRSLAAALYGAIWYLVLCSRFQGFTGVTEPIATAPLLIGLALWAGAPLDAKRGWLKSLTLGIGLGLSVYVRQQAGLLSLGVIWLAADAWRGRDEADRRTTRNRGLGQIALLACSATGTCLLGLLAEGKGLVPLTTGLAQVSRYPAEGNLLRNLYSQVRADETAAAAALLVVGVCLWTLVSRTGQDQRNQNWMRLAGFCALAGLATLLQFAKRPYGHYTLLAIPCLVVSAVILFQQREAFFSHRIEKRFGWASLVLAAIPLAYSVRADWMLQVWRTRMPENVAIQRLWHHQDEIASDLAALRASITDGEKMLVMPRRHNSPYYLLGARSVADNGYAFNRPQLENIDWQRYESALLITSHLDEHDRRDWPPDEIESTRQALVDAGFVVQVQLPTMTLYRKQPT